MATDEDRQVTNPYASRPLPPKSPGTGGWLGMGAALVAMLCLAGVVAISIRSALDFYDEDAGPLPVAAQPVPSPTPSAEKVPKLVMPNELNRRWHHAYESMTKVERKITPAMSFVPGITDLISATFVAPVDNENPENQRLVAFAAGMIRPALRGTALVQDPFDKLRERSVAKTVDITDVAPGSFGGQAQCGNATIDGYEARVCAWADRYTVGLVVFFGSTMDAAKAEFVTIRETIERHG